MKQEVWVRLGCIVTIDVPFDIEEAESTEENNLILQKALIKAVMLGRFRPDGNSYVCNGFDNNFDDLEFEIPDKMSMFEFK
jgi:hypothetical protein